MSSNRDFDRLYREMRGSSPIRASLLLLVIIAFICTAVFWAMFTELDHVTRADGRIVPSSNVQIVQASETGVLQTLYVQEGDVVEQGQVLMELDPTPMIRQLDQEQQRAASLNARIIRLQAMIAEQEVLTFPDQLVALAPKVVETETAPTSSIKMRVLP